MADSRACERTDVHEFHGWDEMVPEAPLGKHFHVCPGISVPTIRSAEAGASPTCTSGDPRAYDPATATRLPDILVACCMVGNPCAKHRNAQHQELPPHTEGNKR